MSEESARSREPIGFPIIGMGASAGGLEAFEKFFAQMPQTCGMAFILVQHLAPDHKSLLAELLAKSTSMPVQVVEDGKTVERENVYVIPPNCTLTIEHGVLQLATPAQPRGQRKPIDTFFQSLAEDQKSHAVCVMLSGTGTDGTIGLRAIKEWGGMAMAQSVESARYDTILRSAISTGLVDYILPVEEMPARLIEYARYLETANGSSETEGHRNAMVERLGQFYALLKSRTGHDFSGYKVTTVIRRIQRRMQVLRIATPDDYLALLKKDHKEIDLLFQDLLIGVTHFFRDPEAYETLAREVVPRLFEKMGPGDTLRVWVAGCASGEEAYSIAILLCEFSAKLDSPPHIKIFATDIDEQALDVARAGRYPASIEQEVSPERLDRFFLKQEGGYQVKKEIRDRCLFSLHSIFRDPPFARLHLITCRNLLIYFGADVQTRLVELFHYALLPGGYLFLGTAESVSTHPELFRTINKKERIFHRRDVALRLPRIFPIEARRAAGAELMPRPAYARSSPEHDIGRIVERSILDQYAPACVVVNEQGDAVYFSGRTGKYLEMPTGRATVSITSMARNGLRPSLSAAIHNAVKGHQPVKEEKVTLETDGHLQEISLSVRALSELGEDAGFYLVVFQEVGRPRKKEAGSNSSAHEAEDSIVAHLESELRSSREHLQATIEELETSNEELKSSNEEYQSANEELETSREETQSLNEELETLNQELKRKLDELGAANNYVRNLMESTEIGTLFLDRELRIKAFTPAISKIYSLLESDVGRPITDFARRFHDGDLAAEIRGVLSTLTPVQQELVVSDGTRYNMRILPFRTLENVIDGVVITFVDVTLVQRAADAIRAARVYAERVVETVSEPLLVLDREWDIRAANPAFYAVFRTTREDTLGRSIYELANGHWDIPELRDLLTGVLARNIPFEGFRVAREFPGVGEKVLLLTGRRIKDVPESRDLVLLAIDDATERLRAEEITRQQQQEERFHFILDAMPEKIFTATTTGDVNYFNSAWMEFTGASFEELQKRGWTRFIHPGDQPESTRLWQHSIDTGEPFAFTHRFRRADGGYRWHLTRAQPIHDSGGGISMWIGADTEIHDQKETEVELRRANEDLNQFAYAASHDLQEPLRMITAYSQLLFKGYRGQLEGEPAVCVNFINEGTKRMRDLLAALLAYSQVGADGDRSMKVTDLNLVFNKAVENCHAAIAETGAVVTSDSLPAVRGHEEHFVQLLQNLIGNAVKYHGPRPPAIHVSAEKSSEEWRIAVTDNGMGIAPEYHRTIFGVFKRLHAKDIPGTGIGLAICRRVVERYGGRIWVESEAGQGAKFLFTLPTAIGATDVQ